MLSSEFDIKKVLSVYQKVLERGEKQGARTFYKGLFAVASYDGYTIELTDDKAHLSVFFHNKYKLEAKNAFEKEDFYQKILKIDQLK